MKLSDLMRDPKLAIDQAWLTNTLPHFLPDGWQDVSSRVPPLKGSKSIVRAYHHASGLTVVVTGETEKDGARWITLTLVHADRVPSVLEIQAVKNIFIGDEHVAMMRLPRVSDQQHPQAVHVFRRFDCDVLPEFKKHETASAKSSLIM